MEVKNGIIIDGMLHELCVGICDECSLQNGNELNSLGRAL